MDTGDLFVKLNDELIIVTNSGCEPGERLIAALREADTAYGNDIDGTYNLATSMEGAIGEVTIDSSSNSADINIDLNGDGDYNDSEEKLYNLPYVFNNEYKAIKLIESNEFKHYGVFVNNDISVWDSYYWNGENWQGDGMSIMVRKNTSLNLSNCTGEYNYVDVDGDTGTYELVNIGNNDTELQFIVDNQNTGITITDSDIDNRGIINISADLVEPEGENENWYMMVLPNKIMIIASANDNAFSGDGGFAIGVKKYGVPGTSRNLHNFINLCRILLIYDEFSHISIFFISYI